MRRGRAGGGRPGRRAVARRVAAEGTVLLVNDGLLPLDPGERGAAWPSSGPTPAQLAMGGGSSEVTPHRRRRVDEALAERLPGAVVTSEVGCRIDRGLPSIDLRPAGATRRCGSSTSTIADRAGEPGGDGRGAHGPGPVDRPAAARAHRSGACSVRLSATFTPDVAGAWRLGLESAGRAVLRLDGEVVVDNTEPVARLRLLRRRQRAGRGDDRPRRRALLRRWSSRCGRGRRPPRSWGRGSARRPPDTGDEFERAVAAAAEADVAVVVVGSNGQWESEGHDRPDLSLPGRQRELVEAVLEVNPRTVVVVNAGSPVEMPWAARAGAVLMTWYPGEEGADALADMLVGRRPSPSGRLPVTFPARVEDGPAGLGVEGDRYPGVEGKVVYGEGVLVGYRFYETTPSGAALPVRVRAVLRRHRLRRACAVDGGRASRVTLVNNGARRGTEVVQVYVRAPESLVRRPDRELAGFAKVARRPRRPGDGPGGARRRRLPLLGRRHARVAHRPRPLRGAGRRVVARHPGECRRDRRGLADVVNGGGPDGGGRQRVRGHGRGTGCSSSRGGPRSSGSARNAHWFAVAAVCVGAFMGQLDASIVTVALPTLQTHLRRLRRRRHLGRPVLPARPGGHRHRGGPLRRHVGTQAALRLRLRDLHAGLGAVRAGPGPRRRCAASGRCRPSARRCCRRTAWPSSCWSCPARSLGRAIGLQGTAQALGLALGPTVGGLLLAAGGWRLIFFVNVPFGLFGAVAAILLVPRSRNLMARVRFDWTGLGIFFPAVVALLSAISFGAELGLELGLIVALFVAAAVLFGAVRLARAAGHAIRCSTSGCSATAASRRGSRQRRRLVPRHVRRAAAGPLLPRAGSRAWASARAGSGADGHAAGLRDRGSAGGPTGRPCRGPAAHRERDGARGHGPGRAGCAAAVDRSGCLLLLAVIGVGHGAVHLTQQRLHHGRRPRASRRAWPRAC